MPALTYSKAKQLARTHVHPKAQIKRIGNEWHLVLPAELDGKPTEASYCKAGSFEGLFDIFNRLQAGQHKANEVVVSLTAFNEAWTARDTAQMDAIEDHLRELDYRVERVTSVVGSVALVVITPNGIRLSSAKIDELTKGKEATPAVREPAALESAFEPVKP